jgi:hypothetical protein
MDLYSGVWLARIEHEQIVKSLPTVPEFGNQVIESKGWLRRIVSERSLLTAIINLIMR